MIIIGQYNFIKQTARSDFKVLPRDRVPNDHFKMHLFMLSCVPTLGIMQYLDHLYFLEYLLLGMQVAYGQFYVNLKYNLFSHQAKYPEYIENNEGGGGVRKRVWSQTIEV